MPSTDWRSPAAYAHARSIPAAGLAWEYLRRDNDYRRAFRQVSTLPRTDIDARTAFSEHWGLRFPGRSRSIGRSCTAVLATELLPDAFHLQPDPSRTDDPAAMPVNLASLPGLDVRAGGDGAWHGLWRLADAAHQFWLVDTPATIMTSYVVILPLDALFELRCEAVSRFWRALVGRPSGERLHDLPPPTRHRHILILRALDGRNDGASYRKIGETLLGFHGRKADWEADPRQNQTRRLVADGLHYMHGGYRELLRYPIHLPRRR